MQPQNSNSASTQTVTSSKQDVIAFPSIHPESEQTSTIARWSQQWFRRLSIRNKISCGYALAIGVAVLGTVAGTLISSYYQQQAEVEAQQAHTAGILLKDLQIAILQARSHQQQLISLLPQPTAWQEEYTHFIEHINTVNILFKDAKSPEVSASVKELSRLVNTYDGVTESYFQRFNKLLKQINLSNLQPEQIPKIQTSLLRFTNSAVALRFDSLSNDLTAISKVVLEKENNAEIALQAAKNLGIIIIVVSTLASIVSATLLAIYTSRAIARPLTGVTQVAQQVTQNSNFDLQAPVTSNDEVGQLASSLNQLIQRVKSLLEQQKVESTQQLLQAEKMSSLGRMLAGVAHEINNPVNFIYGNLEYANNYINDLLTLVNLYETEIPTPPISVQEQVHEIDLEFLKEDLPKILKSMEVGADRVRHIVLSLKNFSRLDESQASPVDLHDCIDSTLLILNNRIKKGIKVTRNYSNIPQIEGYTGALYQVFMNLLSNAIDTLDEKLSQHSQHLDYEQDIPTSFAAFSPEIIITTKQLDQHSITIAITDNGRGILPDHHLKIFETFFTTKPRGVGTGLGLSISYEIIVEKHGGQLTLKSSQDQETTFLITLPIQHPIKKTTVSLTALAVEQKILNLVE